MRTTVTGLRAWLVQRVTAVYMLLFILLFLAHAIVDPPHSYPAWRAWLMNSGVSIATGVFFAALLAHAWVGVRATQGAYWRRPWIPIVADRRSPVIPSRWA